MNATATPEITVAQALMAIHRYEEFVSKQLNRTRWSSHLNTHGADLDARAEWINARREYLKGLLTRAGEPAPSHLSV